MNVMMMSKQRYEDWRSEILREDPFARFEHEEVGDAEGNYVTRAYSYDGYLLGEYE